MSYAGVWGHVSGSMLVGVLGMIPFSSRSITAFAVGHL
jgi:hypothetical protein